MSRGSFLSRSSLTLLMLTALLFGALGQSLTQAGAAPQPQVQAACYGGPIAQWTFTGNVTTPSSGAGVLSSGGVTGPSFITSGIFSPPAVSYSGWNVPAVDTSRYLDFSISTLGRTGVSLTFTSNRSDTGPTQFDLQYSIDGGAYTSAGSRTITTDELLYTYSLDSSFDNKTSIVFRLYGYSASSSSGTWRIDNVTFTGTCTVLDNTPTSTSTSTASPMGSVIINEVAWMGTLASTSYEWIELYNPGVSAVDISLWNLSASDGSPSIIIPSGTSIPSNGYFLLANGNVFSPDVTTPTYHYSGALMSDSGETLVLRDASNSFIDAANGNGGAWPAGTLTTASNHGTMERMGTGADADANWITSSNPGNAFWFKHDIAGNLIHGTPGGQNWGYGVTNTPTSTSTITPTASYTPTITPTFTRTITPTFTPSKTVVITEVAWMGTQASSNDEWIELYNSSNVAVDMTGWQIRAFTTINAAPQIIPIDVSTCSLDHNTDGINDCLIPAKSYFLLVRGRDDVVSGIPPDVIEPDVVYPNTYQGVTTQLSNSGSELLLCTPANISANNCKPTTPNLNNVVVDIANNYDVGPGIPTPSPSTANPWPAGNSSYFGTMERKNLISNEDTNWFTHPSGANPHYGEDWKGTNVNGTPKHPNWAFEVTATPHPTATPTRTRTPVALPGPVLVLNEFVPRPGHDWNNDGQVNTQDEFIEVINAGQVSVNLSQYKVDNYEQDASGKVINNGFTLPGKTLQPGEIAVFYASQTGIFLSDAGDTVRLLKASNNTIVDAFTYPAQKSLDVSYCRYTDGYGSWLNHCFPTPGLPNALTGDLYPPQPGGAPSAVCLLPDNAPPEFILAECEQGGLDIWNPAYWDSFPGEGGDVWLFDLWSKWLSILQ